MNKIHIIGIGFRPLEKRAGDAVLQCEDVLVNGRLLEVFKGYTEYDGVKDKIIIHANVYETLDYIADKYKQRKISLLAAGDPMFFGIGRLVVERLGRDAVEVFPDLSSIQVAFSRVRETSNNALFISLHGGPDPAKRRKMEHEITELPSLLQKHPKIAILTDKVNTPEKIAETFLERSSVKIYVCEKIGYENESITEGTPEEISQCSFEHPNVVIIKNTAWASCHMPTHVFGLKEDEIMHSKGLITKDEVRAVTIHKLCIPDKGVFWDVGAGSGSVSIEASRLCSDLRVFAVEKSEEQIDNIKNNIEKYAVLNIEVVKGTAPEALNDLPAPDRIFIGGSGGNLSNILDIACSKMSSGIIVINATTIETLNEAIQSLRTNGIKADVCEVSISRSKMVAEKLHMSALNPIFIIKGEKQ